MKMIKRDTVKSAVKGTIDANVVSALHVGNWGTKSKFSTLFNIAIIETLDEDVLIVSHRHALFKGVGNNSSTLAKI